MRNRFKLEAWVMVLIPVVTLDEPVVAAQPSEDALVQRGELRPEGELPKACYHHRHRRT